MPLPENPTIKLMINGLMVLHHNESSKQFEIGVHSKAAHDLAIYIFRVPPDRDTGDAAEPVTFSARLSTNKSLGDPIGTGNISLNVAKPEKAVLARYENGSFLRLDGLDDPNDFRWIVQLDGRDFHNRPLPVPVFRGVFKPIITLNSGLFYTAYRIPVRKIPPRDQQTRGATTTKSIATRVAWFTGVNIYLNADNPEATLSYFDDTGAAKSIKIKNDPGVTYLGYIFNLAAADSHFHEDESDFQYYYDAFDVPLRERFDIRGSSDATTSVSAANIMVSESSVATSNLIPADFEPRVSPGRPCIQGYLGGTNTSLLEE